MLSFSIHLLPDYDIQPAIEVNPKAVTVIGTHCGESSSLRGLGNGGVGCVAAHDLIGGWRMWQMVGAAMDDGASGRGETRDGRAARWAEGADVDAARMTDDDGDGD